MNITKHIGIYFPWSTGIGTLGIKLGRFYCDLFWSNYPMQVVDDAGIVELDNGYTWRDYIPSGIYLRAPWFIWRGRVIGGGQYYLWLRQFWRGFKRKRGS